MLTTIVAGVTYADTFQSAGLSNAALNGVNSLINAGSANVGSLAQLGGAVQNALLGLDADADVGAAVNAGADNTSFLSQFGFGNGVQLGTMDNVALSDVASGIAAGSANDADVLQAGLAGLGVQNAVLGLDADTDVASLINAGASNNAALLQVLAGNGVQSATNANVAATDVDSDIAAGSLNSASVTQLGGGGVQNAQVCCSSATTDVASLINAGSANDVELVQVGGGVNGAQNADLAAAAVTSVDSDIAAGSANDTDIVQVGGDGAQNAEVSNVADTGVASLINAGAANEIDALQVNGGAVSGAASQNMAIDAAAVTAVDSDIAAGSSNDTDILQLGGDGVQNAVVGNAALNDTDSVINAGSSNSINALQVSGSVNQGASAGFIGITAPAVTVVGSSIDSNASNETGVVQAQDGDCCGAGGLQNVEVGNLALNDTDSTINAGATNDITVNQIGGPVTSGAQALSVNVVSPATTIVNSDMDTNASNATGISQDQDGEGGLQNAEVGNAAINDTDSTINAGAANNIGINQIGGPVTNGAQAMAINVLSPATTIVSSDMDTSASNETGIEQEQSGDCCGAGGLQNAGVGNLALNDTDSTINAGSANNIGINQIGGPVTNGAQALYVEVISPATTAVDSSICTDASNATGVSQDQDGGGVQNADVDNAAVNDTDSTINAGSANDIEVNQIGAVTAGGASAGYVQVVSPATTTVDSDICASASNETAIEQDGGGGTGAGGVQNADVDNAAVNDTDSEINAGSANDIDVTQAGGGNGSQSATVESPASTTVDSTINAGSSNSTGVVQNGGGSTTSGFSFGDWLSGWAF